MYDMEISPEGRNFYQGRVPDINSDPEGEIYLSFMDWLMMDYFSPNFREF